MFLVFLIIVFSVAVALSSVVVFVPLTVLLMFFLPNQEIQCYICKSFGHLCCINFVDTSPREVACYRSAQLGHTGLVSFTRNAYILLLELIGRMGSVGGKVVLCQ